MTVRVRLWAYLGFLGLVWPFGGFRGFLGLLGFFWGSRVGHFGALLGSKTRHFLSLECPACFGGG